MSLNKERIETYITNCRCGVVDPWLACPDLPALIEMAELALRGLNAEGLAEAIKANVGDAPLDVLTALIAYEADT